MSSRFSFLEGNRYTSMSKWHCSEHSKYLTGCEACKKVRRVSTNNGVDPLNTQHANGRPKRGGIYSDENISRFNELGKQLTERKE